LTILILVCLWPHPLVHLIPSSLVHQRISRLTPLWRLLFPLIHLVQHRTKLAKRFAAGVAVNPSKCVEMDTVGPCQVVDTLLQVDDFCWRRLFDLG
jgi:hypothetical protein